MGENQIRLLAEFPQSALFPLVVCQANFAWLENFAWLVWREKRATLTRQSFFGGLLDDEVEGANTSLALEKSIGMPNMLFGKFKKY
jgi:hypothetical protein